MLECSAALRLRAHLTPEPPFFLDEEEPAPVSLLMSLLLDGLEVERCSHPPLAAAGRFEPPLPVRPPAAADFFTACICVTERRAERMKASGTNERCSASVSRRSHIAQFPVSAAVCTPPRRRQVCSSAALVSPRSRASRMRDSARHSRLV